MRPRCARIMSTVGLTAQESSFPVEHPFLRGGCCHAMAGPGSSWSPRPALLNQYCSMDVAHAEYGSRLQQKAPPPPTYEKHKHSPGTQRLPPKKCRPTNLSLSGSAEPSTPSPADDDQVVPFFQRLSVHECSSPPQTPGRSSKPLPPPPLPADALSEGSMDSDLEFFSSSDSSCLVPEPCSKPSPFRCGAPGRRSFRDRGQINPAYNNGPSAPQVQRQQHRAAEPPEAQQPELLPVCQRQQDRAQRRVRRSHSGPAGSFNKPSLLRLTCQKRHTHGTDRHEVPPPVPPRTVRTTDHCHWSVEVSSGTYSDEDRPPKLPPRDHLCRGSPRTPSPKSLPTYANGVMPATQSFAPDPNYVSCLRRQNSEGSPCILPIMENGRKVSSTHYLLV